MHFSLALLLVTYSLKTVTRNLDWESGMTIYTSGVKLNPASGVMQSNLGIEYAMRNQYDMSEKLYRASMEAAPDYARAFFNFGKLMKIQDQHDSAEWVSTYYYTSQTLCIIYTIIYIYILYIYMFPFIVSLLLPVTDILLYTLYG